MKKPDFYCENFIECNSNLKEYQPSDCDNQCEKCIDIVLDYHLEKNTKVVEAKQLTKNPSKNG